MQNGEFDIDLINEIIYDIVGDEESSMVLLEEYLKESSHHDWNKITEWVL